MWDRVRKFGVSGYVVTAELVEAILTNSSSARAPPLLLADQLPSLLTLTTVEAKVHTGSLSVPRLHLYLPLLSYTRDYYGPL